jgi:hypothetical protein
MSRRFLANSTIPARLVSVALLAVACLALGGVNAQAGSSSAAAAAAAMDLTRADVGSGFSSHQEAYTPAELAQQGTWTLAQLQAWGYEAGFERVFDHDLGTVRGEQIASNAGVYRTAPGATQSLIANGNECTVGPWTVLRSPQNLGEHAVFCTQTGTEDGYQGRLYFLAWQIGRFKGSITLSGIINHVSAAEAIALARAQAVKM